MRTLDLRLARLEVAAARSAPSYVVRVPSGAIGDEAIARAAIAKHRQRTGWMGPVLLVEPELTHSEWLARYGAGAQ
jgi:hypothetical protein